MTAEQFLDELEQKDLLPDTVIANLRKQVATSKTPVSPKSIGKLLIDKGMLTSFQVERLLPAEPVPQSPAPDPKPEPTPAAEPAAAQPSADEFGLAPLEEDSPAPEPLQAAAKASPEPVEPTTPTQPAGSSLLDEELSPLDGGLDDLSSGGSLDALGDAEAGSPLMPTSMTKKKKGLFGILKSDPAAKKEREEKESPRIRDSIPQAKGADRTPILIAVVAGTVVGLVLLGGVLWWSLSSKGADKMLDTAHESYNKVALKQAIEDYNNYLKAFPKHEGASLARVRIGLAKLNMATDGSSDFGRSLATAKEIIEQIENEKDFGRAQGDLASILPDIAEGLADEASAAATKINDPKFAEQKDELAALANEKVALAMEAMELVDKAFYVPAHLRDETRLNQINGTLAFVRSQIGREESLNKALIAINAAIDQKQPAEAYQILGKLIKDYSDLRQHPSIVAIVPKIAEILKSRVEFVRRRTSAETEEPTSKIAGTVVLANRSGEKAPDMTGRVVFALAAGAAYGLDAETGNVLWRRWVGFDTDFAPVPLSDRSDADVLLVDSVRDEIVRVESTTGRLRWRHPVGERLAGDPVIMRSGILVATRSGRLISINPETGDSASHAVLPQKLRTAPGGDPRPGARKSYVYQAGDHSNLYVLSVDEGRCEEALYVGHDTGSIAVPPAVVLNYVLMVENRGHDWSILHVMATNRDGLGVTPVEQHRLRGTVHTPILVFGRRFLVTTDLGGLYVYETPVGGDSKKLRPVGERPATEESPLRHFPLERDGQLWMADRQLTHFEIQFSQAKIKLHDTLHSGESFQQPLQSINEVLFLVRRPPGKPGMVVSAVDMATGETTYWQTHLASSPAGAPLVDRVRRQVIAATSIGGIYELAGSTVTATETQTVNKPIPVNGPGANAPLLVDRLEMGEGVVGFMPGAGARYYLQYDPRKEKLRARWIGLQLPGADKTSCQPVLAAGNILSPGKQGPVYLFAPESGAQQAAPFQPPQGDVNQFAWRRPAVSENGTMVISDGSKTVYALTVQEGTPPRLAATAQSPLLGDAIVSPVAVLGDVVYAVDQDHQIQSMRLPKLDAAVKLPLGEQPTWGPQRVGQNVLIATDTQLVCLDAQQKIRWRADLDQGGLAGTPLAADDHFLITTKRGSLLRIDTASGRETARIDLGQALGSGPIMLGRQVLILGHDSCVHRVALPE